MAELNIGALTDSKSYTGSVGTANIFDLYKFNISSPGSFKFSIDNLSGNADIFLLDNSGAPLYSSTNAGNATETISADSLIAGDYTVKVVQRDGDIKYTLNLAETNTQQAAADTLTGAKAENPLVENSATNPEQPTANKDLITGDSVDDKTVISEAKPATTAVNASSETSTKSETEQPATATTATVATLTNSETQVSAVSETSTKSETEKSATAPAVTEYGNSKTQVNSDSNPAISTAEKTSETATANTPNSTVTTTDDGSKSGETVAAAPDASKPADKPNTATNNGEDKKTENAETSIQTAETTKELEPPTNKPITASNPFTFGTFIVDSTGKVGIDYILDGGLYRGQLAIISLKGMEKFVPGSEEFIKEAAARAMSNSEKGYIVIDDLSEGARFSGNLPEGNFNEGAYLGVKTFSMTPGDEFGIMIVPNGTVKFVYDYPTFGGDKRPLFSMVTANPNEAFHLGQIADVTGEGNTFAMEDLRFDLGTDKDYNDFTFQIRGATGKAPLMDDVVNPDKDWRKTDLGKAVIAYAKPYITPEPETKPNLEGEVSDLIDDLEKEILNPSISDKETPKAPEETAATDKNTAEPIEAVPTEKVDETPAIPAVKTEEPVKYTAKNSDNSTAVETADKVDSKPIGGTTTLTADKDTAADATEKLPVEKTPVSPTVATEEKDKVAETPAATTLPDRTTAETEVATTTTTEKVETKPEVLPAENKQETEVVKTATTEIAKSETPKESLVGNTVDSAVKDSLTGGSIEPQETAEVKPDSSVKETSMPATAVNKGEESQAKEIVTETPAVNDAIAPKESLPISAIVKEPTEINSTVPAKNREEISQKENDVNADWIARLESIKQRLSNLGSAGVVGENAGDRTLISRLETMTEKLKEQTKTTAISDNTASLISRLEDMVVKVAPKPVEPIQPVPFEFPVADRPLVGFINETGLTVNNPAGEKSAIVVEKTGDRTTNSSPSASAGKSSNNPIVGLEKTDDRATNSSPSANAGNNSSNAIADRVETAQSNGAIVNNNSQQPVAKPETSSNSWVQSLIKFVDDAKVSKQPHAVVNININLTETQPDGTVIPRSKLTAEERAAIAYAYQNKVIVVVPAGDNPGTMSALGLLSKEVDNVVTVGAAQRFNNSVALSNAFKLADYSGSGNTLDILANGSSGSTSSTEVAAVEVTNGLAQVLAANPKLNYTQAIDLIKRTATDLDRPNWDAQTGSGLLNVAAAVQLAKVTTPELYTIKPGQRSITDVFISQHPSTKQLPGDPTHPTVKVPGIPQTNVDRGSNNLANATQLIPSATEDVIDQVSSVDPSDIYRVDSRYLNGAKFSVLSGDLSVSYLTTSGQLLGTQSFSKGSHKLQLPANAPAEIIVKIDQRNANPATYVLSGFESTATEPFNIDLEYETPLSASQQAIMQAAAKSVAGLIGKGLPSAVVDGKIIDDINIKISTANIDGAIGTQARTKIDFMRYGSMLPAQSLVQFDAADIAELERSGKLFSVVQHEFLHALGFGNLWEAKGLVDYAGTPLAQYNGGKAVDAFKDLGGLTDAISLETEGKGSAGFHWNEALFQDEVMTADLNFSGKAGNAPISPVTIASLADLGYEVNLNAATPDFGLFGGGRFNPEDLTPEQIEAFRQLAEESLANQSGEFIAAILPEVDPNKVAPEIWAHAERFSKNGEYYDWEKIVIGNWRQGHTISDYVLQRMTHPSKDDHRSAIAKANDPDYWRFISNRNGFPDPNWIVQGNEAWVPVWNQNYEQEQEAERLRREEELRQRQEEEARIRREQEEAFAREQERVRQEEEARRREAEARQRELEEQERRLREQMERIRQEEERRLEEARLAELARQAEIARQQGKGGLDWYLAKPLPEFGPVDPFETSLTGETVGNLVPDDYYRFTLSRGGRITAELRKLLADADLVLYDVRNRPIAYSMREGITDEQIIADLIPGTYMLRVNSPKGVTTDYELIVKFKHKLSQSEIGPPAGWRIGGGNGNGGNGSGGGNIPPGATFADPRIEKIFRQAVEEFAAPERRKAKSQVDSLKAERDRLEREKKALIESKSAELRGKVHGMLDRVKSDQQGNVNGIANNIKGGINGVANGAIGGINGLVPDWVFNTPFVGGWIRDRFNQAKGAIEGAINGARNWLNAKVDEARNTINSAISWFIDQAKNLYFTAGEANIAIEGIANQFRGMIENATAALNGLIGNFKGMVLGQIEWTRNIGIPNGWNLYDNAIVGLVNNLTNGVQDAVRNTGRFFIDRLGDAERGVQRVIAEIGNLLGDETGRIYNQYQDQIRSLNNQIEAITNETDRRIRAKEAEYKNQLQDFLTQLGDEGKKILDTLLDFGNTPAGKTMEGQVGMAMIEVGLGMIPVVGQVVDIKDTVAALYKWIFKGERTLGVAVEFLAALAGWVPVVGDAIKSVAKIVLKGPIDDLLKRFGPEVTQQVAKAFKETNWKTFLIDVVTKVVGIWRKFDSNIDRSAGWILDLLPGFKPTFKAAGNAMMELSNQAPKLGDSLNEASQQIANKFDDEVLKLPGPDPNLPRLPGAVKVAPGSVDDLLIGTEKLPLKSGVNPAIQYEKNGGIEKAWQDYQDFTQGLNPQGKNTPDGFLYVVELPDGSKAIGRGFSSGDVPTIEIQKPNGNVIKVRYKNLNPEIPLK